MNPLAIFLALSAAGSDDLLPQALPKDRYAETVAKSPFVLETKGADAPAAPEENPFANLYLRGISKGDGKDYVLVQRLGEERPMRFIGNEPGPDGISVQSIRVGNSFRETKVTLKKGEKTGEVGFKEETSPPPPPPGAVRPAMPGQMPMQFPKPGANGGPPPLPGMRAPQAMAPGHQVPRPQGAVPPPPMPGVPKGRVRVINNN